MFRFQHHNLGLPLCLDTKILTINLGNKSLVSINVNSFCTVSDLKQILCEKYNFSNSFNIVYHGDILDENSSINRYQISNHDQLLLVPILNGGMKLMVKNLEGKIFSFEVDGNETIGNLKAKIYEKSGVEPSSQKLYFRGSILNNDQTINEKGLMANCTINLVVKLAGSIQVEIDVPNNRTLQIDTDLDDTIGNLKEKIRNFINVPVKSQILIFECKILENNMELRNCGIVNGCRLNMVISKTNFVIYGLSALLILVLAYEIIRFFQ